jgi:serine protease Do
MDETMKKLLILLILGAAILTGCVTNSAPDNVVSTFEDALKSTITIDIGEKGKGSAFYIGGKGDLFVTSAHCVISNFGELYSIKVGDNELIPVAINMPNDIALIKYKDNSKLPKIKRFTFDVSKLTPEDKLFSIGSHMGKHELVTSGHVNHAPTRPKLLITNIPMNVGCSGGPVLNDKMQVVGLNAAIMSKVGGWNGISYHISASTILELVNHYWSGSGM